MANTGDQLAPLVQGGVPPAPRAACAGWFRKLCNNGAVLGPCMMFLFYVAELVTLQGRCFSGDDLGWDQPLGHTAKPWFWFQLVFNALGMLFAVAVACLNENFQLKVFRDNYKVQCVHGTHSEHVPRSKQSRLDALCVHYLGQAPIIGVALPFFALLAFQVWRIFLVGETWLHVAQLGLDLAGYTWLIIAWLLTLASVRDEDNLKSLAHAIGVVGGLAHLLFLIMQVTLISYVEVSEANLEEEQKETPELAVNFLTHVWEEMVGCSMGCRVHVQALWASYVAAGTKSTHSHRFAFVRPHVAAAV